MITRRRRRTVRRVSARRVRRNPPVRRAKRPSPPKMTPAMRAKISRAVKAANRRRAASRGPVARISSRVRSMVTRRSGGSVARRRSIRRSSYTGGSGLVGGFKGAFAKPMLMKAGGAIAASIGTGYILNNYGAKLPMVQSKYGRAAYSLIIPVGVAALIRNKQRDLAEGLVIGGLVMAITEIIRVSKTPAGGTVGSFIDDTNVDSVRPLPSFGVSGELGYSAYPTSVNDMGARVNSPAFSGSIWGN